MSTAKKFAVTILTTLAILVTFVTLLTLAMSFPAISLLVGTIVMGGLIATMIGMAIWNAIDKVIS